MEEDKVITEEKNEIVKIENMELTPETYVSPLNMLTAFEKKDIDFFVENKKHIAKVFRHTWIWRTDGQKRSIISDFYHPTLHSKFHQAILEQKVQLDQAIQLAKDIENAKLDTKTSHIEVLDLERKIENCKDEIDRMKLEVQLDKVKLQLKFKEYELANSKVALEYRMKEVKGWQNLENQLIEAMTTRGFTEEQIWNKESGEVYTNFFTFLNMYLGIKQSTDSGEVNNLTSLALFGIKEAIESGAIKQFIPMLSEQQRQAIKDLGYGHILNPENPL